MTDIQAHDFERGPLTHTRWLKAYADEPVPPYSVVELRGWDDEHECVRVGAPSKYSQSAVAFNDMHLIPYHGLGRITTVMPVVAAASFSTGKYMYGTIPNSFDLHPDQLGFRLVRRVLGETSGLFIPGPLTIRAGFRGGGSNLVDEEIPITAFAREHGIPSYVQDYSMLFDLGTTYITVRCPGAYQVSFSATLTSVEDTTEPRVIATVTNNQLDTPIKASMFPWKDQYYDGYTTVDVWAKDSIHALGVVNISQPNGRLAVYLNTSTNSVTVSFYRLSIIRVGAYH